MRSRTSQSSPLAPVPDREREHAAEAVEAVDPPLLERVDDHLGVGVVGAEAMAGRLELGAELGVVVDLAVEDEPHRAVLVRHRLHRRRRRGR